MGLTDEIRDALARCGFTVAPMPFDGGKHYCSRGDLRASIDTSCNRLSLWGTTRVLTIPEALAEFAGEGDAKPSDKMPLKPHEQAWLDRCVRAGIRILDGPRPPAANCEAVAPDGRSIVLLPWTQTIRGDRFCRVSLAEFEPRREIATTGRNVSRSLFGEGEP